MPASQKVVVILLWLFAVHAAWLFLCNYWAPDICLDSLHGSFDYKAWQCSQDENKPFVDTPLFLIPGFTLAFVSFVVAACATALPRRQSAGRPL